MFNYNTLNLQFFIKLHPKDNEKTGCRVGKHI